MDGHLTLERMTSSADASDCEKAAIRAFLLGADDECITHWETAQRAAVACGQPAEAARYAFWLGFLLMAGGQPARANGWFARSESLIEQAGVECRASGYLLIPRVWPRWNRATLGAPGS